MRDMASGASGSAEMERAHGKSPVMWAMATEIIAAQKNGIAAFDRWLTTAE